MVGSRSLELSEARPQMGCYGLLEKERQIDLFILSQVVPDVSELHAPLLVRTGHAPVILI